MKGGQWFFKKNIGVNVEDDDLTVDTRLSPFSTQMPPTVNREEEVDNVRANHNDHDEGELINIIQCNLFNICMLS